MKPSPRLSTGLAFTCLLGLVGCSKAETATSAASSEKPAATQPAAAAQPAAPAASAPVATTPATPAATIAAAKENVAATTAATIAAARESLTALKLPDFKTASAQQLSTLAAQTLTQWTQTIESPTPEVTAQVETVKTALAKEQTTSALSSLSTLGDYAKSIPGAEALLESSKQLISAWALKQGFDSSKISGALGALQKGDYVTLASQAAGLFSKGGVSDGQKSILDGVLDVFGLDSAQASGAINALNSLLGK